MRSLNRNSSLLCLQFCTSWSSRAISVSRFRGFRWAVKQSCAWLRPGHYNPSTSINVKNHRESTKRTGTVRILLGCPLGSRSCRSRGLQDIGHCATISAGIVMQLNAYFSCVVEYRGGLHNSTDHSYTSRDLLGLPRSSAPWRGAFHNRIGRIQLRCSLGHCDRRYNLFSPTYTLFGTGSRE